MLNIHLFSISTCLHKLSGYNESYETYNHSYLQSIHSLTICTLPSKLVRIMWPGIAALRTYTSDVMSVTPGTHSWCERSLTPEEPTLTVQLKKYLYIVQRQALSTYSSYMLIVRRLNVTSTVLELHVKLFPHHQEHTNTEGYHVFCLRSISFCLFCLPV